MVGVSDYFDKKMEDLRFAENDVKVIGSELKKLGFEVTVLTGKQASRSNVDQQLEVFFKATEKLENDDIVYVMFSGHGQQLIALQEKKVIVNGQVQTLRKKGETPYFCARDAKPYDPLRNTLAGKNEKQIAEEFNLISLNRVIAELDVRSNSKRNLLVVDACRNNPAKGKTANITGSTAREIPTGLSMLFAAKSGEKSWESSDPKIKHGVMSHFLIQGLKGKAVTRRHEVTWKRLVAYVSEEVEYDQGKIAGAGDRIQHPHAVGNSNLIVLGKWTGRYTSSKTGMQLAMIPRGNFWMGSPKNEQHRDDDEKRHRVTISKDYYMGIHEVTQAQWKAVMGTEPWMEKSYVKEDDSFPATYVNWDDAVAYCKKLSAIEGQTYRLPTEAEWEYACRAGTKSHYSFGDAEQDLGEYAWYEDNAWDVNEKHAHKVGTKLPNPWGLFDMHGNVWEWCQDAYGEYPDSAVTDPLNKVGSLRASRGGSFSRSSAYCRSANRDRNSSDFRNGYLGFRVVLVQ